MSGNETRTSQFGLVSGIRQSTSDLITIAEPETLFGPEARKGRLYIVVECDNDHARSRDACQLAARTARRAFYDDSSFSVTAGLRAAVRAANKALYQSNFNVDSQRRTYVGLTCAVIKGNDLFIAQVAPAQAYVLSEGTLRALPAPPAWNPAHVSATPFLQPHALGKSLFIEPELYRSLLRPADALALCSSNIAALLRPEEIEQILRYQDPSAATESLHTLCRQNGLTEAHALVIELLPALSAAARNAPLSPVGLSERGRLALQTVGNWITGFAGEVALVVRGNRDTKTHAGKSRSARANGDGKQSDPLKTLPEQPDLPVNPMPKPRPIDLGDNLDERYTRERAVQREESTLPPSTFLGEDTAQRPTTQQRIDLSDMPSLAAQARPYRPRREARPLVDMSWQERLVLPFERIGMAAFDLVRSVQRGRVAPPSMPTVQGRGLSYRRQKPPFPWIPLLVIVLLVALLILYGMDLSRRSAQQNVRDILDQAGATMAAVYEAPDNATALGYLDDVEQIIDQVRANPLVTETNTVIWSSYLQLQSEYERAQAELQRVTFLESPTILAEHPLPNGRFASIVVPPPTSSVTDTFALEALGYIYALDGDREAAQLYRIPRDGGAPEPYLNPGETVQQSVVGPLQAQAWSVDNIVAVDQGVNGFGYYFRNANQWNYIRLGGSEVWAPRGRLDLETYEGNLYAWGAETGEILKYISGQYGNPPELWLDPAGLAGHEVSTAVDMAIDGNIYLLQPDGRTLVLSTGRVVREIIPEDITPPISAVTRFFVTGTPEGGWIFLVDTLNERIIQVDKSSGAVIQQMRMRTDSPIRLNELTDLYVDDDGSRPLLYIVNGGQILRIGMPAPPRPFRQSETPVPTPVP